MDSGSSSSKIARKQLLAKQQRSSAFTQNDQQLRQKLEVRSDAMAMEKPAVSANLGSAQNRNEKRIETEFSLIASDLNRREFQIRQTRNDLKNERRILRKLKYAYENDDLEEIEHVKNELLNFKALSRGRQEQIYKEQQLAGQVKSLQFDTAEQNSIKLPVINNSIVKQDIPENVQQISQEYERIDKEISTLYEAKKSADDARHKLSSIFNKIKASPQDPLKMAPKSIEGAEFLADKISEQASYLSSDQIVRAAFGRADIKERAKNIYLLL